MSLIETLRLPMAQFWLQPKPTATPGVWTGYRPALLLECQLRFHHLRAQIKHSVERRFVAWYPKGQAVADWDDPSTTELVDCPIVIGPMFELPYLTDGCTLTEAVFQESVSDLIERLARAERLTIFHNPQFNAFSEPDEPRESFITRLAEQAANSIEEDLQRLVRHVHMKIGQVRETQERRGRKLNIPDPYLSTFLMEHRHELFMSEARLEALLASGERLVVIGTDGMKAVLTGDPDYQELQQTLQRIEEETRRELNELCTRCIQSVSECDPFTIGLQPKQIHPVRQGILWVPV